MRKIWKKVVGLVIVAFVYITTRTALVDLQEGSWAPYQPKPPPGTVRSLDDKFPGGTENKLDTFISKHSINCPVLRPPSEEMIMYRNGYWQTLTEGSLEVYIISAFYDDRPIAGLLPHIRLLAVSTVLEQDLFCQVWYPGYPQPLMVPVAVTPSGRGDKLNEVKYQQSLYTCDLPVSLPTPSQVSISTGACKNSTTHLALNIPVRSKWEHEFGICVAIAFGKILIQNFVEWIEFHRMLGVTEFNIYDGNVMRDMDDIFQYYHKMGILHVYSMPPPVMDFSKKGVKLSSPASLNDCMMRNMYRYRYMITIDFDEFIVPRNHYNYTDMLDDIDKKEKLTSPAQSYTFRNLYYFDHFPQDESEQLKIMKFRHHAEPSKFLYAGKSFVDPKTCLSVFNHFCYKRFTKAKHFTIDVDSSVASNHHYRTCGFDKNKCKDLSKKQIPDDSVLRFKKQLTSHVQHILADLGKHGAVN